VERLVLKCGYVAQWPSPDYGYDLRLETFDDMGGLEDEHVPLQVKATDAIHGYVLATEECFSFPVSTKDYRLWSEALMPVFFILYDAQAEKAYWLHVQDYENAHHPNAEGNTLNMHIPHSHVLGVQTIRMMRQRKQDIVQDIKRTRKKETQ